MVPRAAFWARDTQRSRPLENAIEAETDGYFLIDKDGKGISSDSSI
jgi:hypothetical protein